jgi:glycosyltransferase involved in cell wall biosynthesis
MSAPLTVTCVVPCRNRAPWLRPTIDSILEQDHDRVECIVVDACSTDGTLDILKSYGSRIRWVSEPDRGHADAINKGWRRGSGQVLAWLNADDTWAGPHAARTAAEHLADHPDTAVVYGECYQIDAAGRRVGYEYLRQWDLAYAVEHCDHCVPQAAAFIRREALDRAGWLDEAFYQKKDHELWLRLALVGTIEHLPVPLGCARNIKGLSFDGATAAPACVQVTRKFFSLPDVPTAIRARQRRAMSNAYLRGMDYAFDGGPLWGVMARYAGRAVVEDPSNFRAAWERWRRYRGRAKPQAWAGAAGESGSDEIVRGWMLSQLPTGSGRAAVIEAIESDLPLVTALRGFEVLAWAPRHRPWSFSHPALRFTRDPLERLPWPANHYQLLVLRGPVSAELRPRVLASLKPGGWLLSDHRETGTAFDTIAHGGWMLNEHGRFVPCPIDDATVSCVLSRKPAEAPLAARPIREPTPLPRIVT